MEELFQYCSEQTGCELQLVERIIHSFLEKIAQELSQGQSVDLGKEFGIFHAKLRTGAVGENSPRTPKASRYRVIFRENSGLRQRLKL